jgi:6-phosphofructokinase 1
VRLVLFFLASPSPTRVLSQCRGCETWIVREGYEGLVRGNTESSVNENHPPAQPTFEGPNVPSLLQSLRFGDGDLLKYGIGDYAEGGRSLRGRYIVRVGWDDVRGWFAEVSL